MKRGPWFTPSTVRRSAPDCEADQPGEEACPDRLAGDSSAYPDAAECSTEGHAAGVVDDTQVDGVLPVAAERKRKLEGAGARLSSRSPGSRQAVDEVGATRRTTSCTRRSRSRTTSLHRQLQPLAPGELNAENVLEIRNAKIADELAAFVDEIRALYPSSPAGRQDFFRSWRSASVKRLALLVLGVLRSVPSGQPPGCRRHRPARSSWRRAP